MAGNLSKNKAMEAAFKKHIKKAALSPPGGDLFISAALDGAQKRGCMLERGPKRALTVFQITLNSVLAKSDPNS